ncbi:MAG: tRNA (adenosine(37)-N6)-threonylcarbamoyltransferase complex dimerization subunit type 1 TsaB [Bacteroidales bacterium]
MPVILHIETSGKTCSVALSEEENVLMEKTIREDRSHAKSLTIMIQEMMKSADMAFSRLDAVAVSAGPGSYTGLRIGVSVAKAICFASDIPLIAVPTLEILLKHLFHHVNESGLPVDKADYFVPMIDARRMEVYQVVFDRNGNLVENVAAKIIDETAYSHLLEEHYLVFFGNGAGKCQDIIRHQNALFISDIEPEAKFMTEIALEKYRSKAFEDTAYYEPFYLKSFQATVPKNKMF